MEASKLGPFRLAPWFSPRPWGRRDLHPWYGDEAFEGTTEPVGEAWLTGPQSRVETGPLAGKTLSSSAIAFGPQLLGGGESCGCEFPLLVKLLFPSQNLSVQVHPDDEQAQCMGQPRGKTECWYVLEAEQGATIALGLKPEATPDAVRAKIADGTLEGLMQWVPVSVGDMIFVDAGTVHAIGPGVVLLETQQTCDVTFRMYDYGRPRELHVEQALAVMKPETAAGKIAPKQMSGFIRLIEERYFTVDRYDLPAHGSAEIDIASAGCLVGISGSAAVACEGAELVDLVAGKAVIVPVDARKVSVRSDPGAAFVRCFETLNPSSDV